MGSISAKRPNILLITSDQQHYATLGSLNPRIRTPALDRLAREGTRFDRAYCNNPVCSPSRSTIITGMYPAWHHCWTIGVSLPEDVPTVGGVFQQNGYDAALIGKAHFQPVCGDRPESLESISRTRDLDFWRKFNGPWYGFNHVETGHVHGHQDAVGQHYALWMEKKGLKNWRDYFVKWPPKPGDKYEGTVSRYYFRDMLHWELPEEYHHSVWVGERSVERIECCSRESKPFFLWASFCDPHPPYAVPEPWASMYDPADMDLGHATRESFDRMPPHFAKTQERKPDFSSYAEELGSEIHGFHSHLFSDEELKKSKACYYGMVSLLDREVGRILACLDRLGIAENTLVLFSTDHGHFIGEHGLLAKGPFHYEDMLRIPLLVRWPGRVPAGKVSDALESQIDFAPTFLEAAGIAAPGYMQGNGRLKTWSGISGENNDWVIVENRHNPTTMHLRTFITKRYKITVYRNAEYGELFDLEEDPYERRNLWDDHSSQGLKLRLMHQFLRAELKREPTRMPRIATA